MNPGATSEVGWPSRSEREEYMAIIDKELESEPPKSSSDLEETISSEWWEIADDMEDYVPESFRAYVVGIKTDELADRSFQEVDRLNEEVKAVLEQTYVACMTYEQSNDLVKNEFLVYAKDSVDYQPDEESELLEYVEVLGEIERE